MHFLLAASPVLHSLVVSDTADVQVGCRGCCSPHYTVEIVPLRSLRSSMDTEDHASCPDGRQTQTAASTEAGQPGGAGDADGVHAKALSTRPMAACTIAEHVYIRHLKFAQGSVVNKENINVTIFKRLESNRRSFLSYTTRAGHACFEQQPTQQGGLPSWTGSVNAPSLCITQVLLMVLLQAMFETAVGWSARGTCSMASQIAVLHGPHCHCSHFQEQRKQKQHPYVAHKVLVKLDAFATHTTLCER